MVGFAVLQSMVPGGLTEKGTLSKDGMGRGSAGRAVGQVLGAQRILRRSCWGDLPAMLPCGGSAGKRRERRQKASTEW